jgi:hypothetical protein
MPSEIVESVKESQWMKDGVEATTYWVTLVDGVGQREVPCYDPRGKDLKEDAPLPEGWEVKTSKAGKLYLAAPKATGSGGFRSSGGSKKDYIPRHGDTVEGFRENDERVDRRKALELAVQIFNGPTGSVNFTLEETANYWYAWLRESVGAARPENGTQVGTALPTDHRGNAGSGRPVPAPTPSDEGGGTSYRTVTPQDSPPPSSSTLNAIAALTCQHEWTDAPRQGWKVCTKCRRAVPEGEAK